MLMRPTQVKSRIYIATSYMQKVLAIWSRRPTRGPFWRNTYFSHCRSWENNSCKTKSVSPSTDFVPTFSLFSSPRVRLTHDTLWFLAWHVPRPFHFLCPILPSAISLGDNRRRLSHNDERVKQSLIWSASLFRVYPFRSFCRRVGTNINYRKKVR